ncbi:MAG: hypothetical protein IPI75_17115 [Gammaproteobacteria bacterium]|nr:hypothetical protein [Gammaproteobacteria bacterium]
MYLLAVRRDVALLAGSGINATAATLELDIALDARHARGGTDECRDLFSIAQQRPMDHGPGWRAGHRRGERGGLRAPPRGWPDAHERGRAAPPIVRLEPRSGSNPADII